LTADGTLVAGCGVTSVFMVSPFWNSTWLTSRQEIVDKNTCDYKPCQDGNLDQGLQVIMDERQFPLDENSQY
jgi:hypothetical protein